jgi:hypothetical protein
MKIKLSVVADIFSIVGSIATVAGIFIGVTRIVEIQRNTQRTINNYTTTQLSKKDTVIVVVIRDTIVIRDTVIAKQHFQNSVIKKFIEQKDKEISEWKKQQKQDIEEWKKQQIQAINDFKNN